MTIKQGYEEILKKEGNQKDFTYKNFECLVRRVMPERSGHLCGYIVIPKDHELYMQDYDEVESKYNYELPSHGGLTFSGKDNNQFLIGFDCAHAYDLQPCYHHDVEDGSAYSEETYRDMAYVEQTLKNMVDFIIKN